MASWRIVRTLEAKRAYERAKQEVEKAKKEKVADRPHKWTVYLACVSPIIAAASIFFSVLMSNRAIAVSDRALRTSQRAYLTIKDVRTGMQVFKSESDIGPLVASIEFDIVNLGNTPARLKDVVLDYLTPEGWNVVNAKSKSNESDMLRQSQIVDGFHGRPLEKNGSISVRKAGTPIRLSREAVGELTKARAEYGEGFLVATSIQIKVFYWDVFSTEHLDVVCVFAANINPGNTCSPEQSY